MLLPQGNDYVSGEVSVFDSLVRFGEEKSCITLPHHLHGFLVECLLEYMKDTGIVQEGFALNFPLARIEKHATGNQRLKRMGDAALILAGLFPQRAQRLNVSVTYIREMGEGAYLNLADKLLRAGSKERALFFGELGIQFHLLVEVLNGTREHPQTAWAVYQQFRMNMN